MARLVLPLLLFTGAVSAQEPGNRIDAPADVWKRECAACHIPYPPYMLPPASWKKLLQGLRQHFDTDASLSDAEIQSISVYLLKHAANEKYFDHAPLRITETDRFVMEHRSIPPVALKAKSVKSIANCQSCHPGAERESFEESELSWVE